MAKFFHTKPFFFFFFPTPAFTFPVAAGSSFDCHTAIHDPLPPPFTTASPLLAAASRSSLQTHSYHCCRNQVIRCRHFHILSEDPGFRQYALRVTLCSNSPLSRDLSSNPKGKYSSVSRFPLSAVLR